MFVNVVHEPSAQYHRSPSAADNITRTGPLGPVLLPGPGGCILVTVSVTLRTTTETQPRDRICEYAS